MGEINNFTPEGAEAFVAPKTGELISEPTDNENVLPVEEIELSEDIEIYLSNEQFWQNIIQQATNPEKRGSPILFRPLRELLVESKEKTTAAAKIACQVLDRYTDIAPDSPELAGYADINTPEQVELHAQILIKWAKEVVLREIGPPPVGYHVSGLDGSELGSINLENFILKPSQGGAMDPGVYSSPYIEFSYVGGDIKQLNVTLPVVFELPLDGQCVIYPVSHSDTEFSPIEISTRYRGYADFTEAVIIDVNDANLPVAVRKAGETLPFDKFILVKGGSLLSYEEMRERTENDGL